MKILGAVFLIFFSLTVYGVSMGGDSIFLTILKLIGYIIVLLGTIVITFYGTKLIASLYKKKNRTSSLIEIIGNYPIGSNQKVILLKVKEKVHVILITGNSSTVIDEFNFEEFESVEEIIDESIGLKDLLKEIFKKDDTDGKTKKE